MIKLKIIKKDKYCNYILEDKDKNKYDVNINFMNTNKPSLGSTIYIQESVLKENVSLNYSPIEKEDDFNEDEIIKLVDKNKEIYLVRLYG